MSTPSWKNVKVAMQSVVLPAAKTITALSNGATANVTSTAHGFTVGQYILLLVQGMSEVNNRIFRVSNVTANTFDLEGINSTNFGVFTTGTAQLVTMGTSFTTLKSVSASGGEFEKQDITTIHDVVKKSRPGMASEVSYAFDTFWDLSDAALTQALSYSNSASQVGFLFTFDTGAKMAFYGFIGAANLPNGSTGEAVTAKITITASGLPTFYTT